MNEQKNMKYKDSYMNFNQEDKYIRIIIYTIEHSCEFYEINRP